MQKIWPLRHRSNFLQAILNRARCIGVIFYAALICISLAQAQPQAPGKFWQSTGQIAKNHPQAEAWIQPEKYHAFDVDHAALKKILDKAPKEFSAEARTAPGEISLPMPDGSSARFLIVESPVMAPELAAKFPEIKTYLGQGIDDPAASVRFDVTPAGLHAQILSPKGAVYIDPAWRGDRVAHSSYYKRDYRKAADGFQCLVPAANNEITQPVAQRDLLRSGSNLRTYRLACAATGEYVAFQGGTVSAGMSAIVTAVNRVTGVYEVELAVRLVLVANNNLLVYTNSSTDPYSNANPSSLLTQNQSNLDSIIGSANYDIGHVFSTGGGGLAALAVVCKSGSKAQGETGLSAPTGDAFYIDYVAHEMGHQFGANHTFNSETGSCGGGNRNASTAYEPGSGSTIMPYAGICGADDLQPHSDPYFHSISFDEIIAYTTTGSGNSCPVLTATGNNAPTVNAGLNYTIPKSTPFTLTATGSDPDGDPLTYCWEERDLGAAQTLADADNGSSPIFRSFNPTSDPTRTFPRLSNILSNTASLGEKLPALSRTMNFRVTARDNRAGGGGVNTSNMQVTVVSAAGPFVVTSPNTSVTWSNTQTVTWNVAGTTAAPINASNVNILLSTNGGNSFPIVLAANTPNDGSQSVNLPSISTSAARIKVQAAGNIFFDISDANFSLTTFPSVPHVILDSTSLLSENCAPGNSVIDPNETVSVNFSLRNTGTANTANLVATLLSSNGVVAPSGPQTYGALIPGGATVSRAFTFTAGGICGGEIHPLLQLQDGTNNLGTVGFISALGSTINFANEPRSNTASITIPSSGNSGPASIYPSTISVTGLTGTIRTAVVTLSNLSHPRPDDLDILLVAPNGQSVLLMSDAGGSATMNNVNLTFDDNASTSLPDATQIVSGSYLPTNFGTPDTFDSPAPAAPYGSSLSGLYGSSPNGIWSLYIMDDRNANSGTLAGGWTIQLVTTIQNCCTGNTPPNISSISNRITSEDVSIGGIAFNVSDAESAASSLVATGTSSNTNLVPNTNLVFSGTGTNRSLAITPATNQFGTSIITISVSDGVTNATTSFLLTVNAVNDAPVLAAISPKTVNEGSMLQFTNSATDVETNQLTFTLDPGAPTNASVNSASGIFSWTPTEAQGPNTNSITIRVTDNGSPNLSATQTVVVTVNEVNVAPVLTQMTNRTIYAGNTLSFTNVATDSDIPANILQFNFDLTVTGAQLNSTNGIFSWTPAQNQLGTNDFTIRVTDNGSPNLNDTKSFSVIVVTSPTIQSVTQTNGQVTLTWNAVSGISYRVQYKTNLSQSTWNDLAGDVTANGSSASKADSTNLDAQRFYRILVLP